MRYYSDIWSRLLTYATRLFWMAFVALVVSHLFHSWQLYRLHNQIRQFEIAHGITPSDVRRVTISEIPLESPMRWRFFAELPPSKKYVIRAAVEKLDLWPNCPQHQETIVCPYDEFGPHPHSTIHAEVWDRKGRTKVRVAAGALQAIDLYVTNDHPLHARSAKLTIETLPDPPVSNHPDVPRILLRIRDPDAPNRGLVIWIEEQRETESNSD